MNFLQAAQGEVTNFADYLPGLLVVPGKPGTDRRFTLDERVPFRPVFSTRLPRRIVNRSSRQIGKTMSIAARLIIDCASTPGEKVLVVTPLQEQSDVLSSTVFKPMIEDSPIRVLLRDDEGVGSVRRRDFLNRSMIQFSFAFLDTERVRSKTCRVLFIDEAQDMNREHVPVIEQCQASYTEATTWISGTSKTKDTFLEEEWVESSQGVWHVRCDACGFDNVCAVEGGHLLSMIGPAREDVSFEAPGTVCHRCQKPVRPQHGRWVHRCPERLRDSAGYFAPQPIFPMHHAYPGKWRELVGRMQGQGGYTTAKFYNECLGEPYDQAYKLLSVDDLRAAAGGGVGDNTEANAAARGRKYPYVVLGVDWGGGGEDGVSRTKVAAAGLSAATGRAEVFFGAQFAPGTDRVAEGREVLRLARLCNATLVAHDFIGVGTASEAVLTHLGWPVQRIAPMCYRGTVGDDLVSYHKPATPQGRGFYNVNKARTLQFLAMAVRQGKVAFFSYDYKSKDEPGLLHDFLALVEDVVDTPNGGAYRIVRKQGSTASDDFAHATNYACCALWEATNSWPPLTSAGVVRP